jgi:hypothetical protein
MEDNAQGTVDSRDPLPWVVPKNPNKWDERLVDWAVAEQAHNLPVSVDQAVATRDTMVAIKSALWEAFRARGKPSKPRKKKGEEEPQGDGEPDVHGNDDREERSDGRDERSDQRDDRDGERSDGRDEREAKAKRILRTLHLQLKSAIKAKRYDQMAALVDRLGVVTKVLARETCD